MSAVSRWFRSLPARLAEGGVIEVAKLALTPSALTAILSVLLSPHLWPLWAAAGGIALVSLLVRTAVWRAQSRKSIADSAVLSRRISIIIERPNERISVQVDTDASETSAGLQLVVNCDDPPIYDPPISLAKPVIIRAPLRKVRRRSA